MLYKTSLPLLLLLIMINAEAQKTKSLPAKVNAAVEIKLQTKVDSLVEAEMMKQKTPGIALAVIRDGKITYSKGYGYSNVEHQVPVKPVTIFQSGSVGKQFTAFAIMQLVEDGKISLDDPISKYFPGAPAEWNKVTVRHLLTHTGGWASYPKGFDFRADYTEDSLYKIISQIPFEFAPGERHQYSNIGYVTLGLLISKVTGKFYGNLLKERVFTPLGMTTARIITEADIVPNRAAGYWLDNGELKNQQWVSSTINTTADGSLYLTVLDMAKWEAALNAGKLLKKESYRVMWSPVKLNNGKTHPYGFGWAIDSLNGKLIIEHGGTWQGFESVIKRYPEKRAAVVVFANLRGTNVDIIASRIMRFYHPELVSLRTKAIHDKEPQVTAFVKEFLKKTVEEKLSSDMFTPEAGPQILDQARPAANFFKSLGPLKQIELLKRTEADNDHNHHYRLIYKAEEIEMIFTITKDNKIAHIDLRRN